MGRCGKSFKRVKGGRCQTRKGRFCKCPGRKRSKSRRRRSRRR